MEKVGTTGSGGTGRWIPVAVAAVLAWIALDSAWELLAGGDPVHPISLLLRGLASAAAVLAALRRHRVAMELSACVCVFSLLAAWPMQIHPPPELVFRLAWAVQLALALAATVALVGWRRRLFGPGRPARRRLGDLLPAIRLTIALFLVAEAYADHQIRFHHQYLLGLVARHDFEGFDEQDDPVKPFVQGLPTVATIGSSALNMERTQDRSAPAILADRFEGRINLLFTDKGGITSDMHLEYVRAVERAGPDTPRPQAFLVYAGFDDFHRRHARQYLQHVDRAGATSAVVPAARWLILHSSLAALSLQGLFRCRTGSVGGICQGNEVLDTLDFFGGNLEEMIRIADRLHARVFVATLAANRRELAGGDLEYHERVNGYLASLPARFANVTLVDFDRVVRKAYPDGAAANCDPFERGLQEGTCGNQFHLSLAGHTLLADAVQPVIEDWLEGLKAR